MDGSLLKDNFTKIKSEISSISKENEIKIVAVSKKQSVDKIKELYDLGQRAFGENYLQEFLQKKDKLNHLKIEWHFIGVLQSNKMKQIAENFSWIQTLGDLKHLKMLQKYAHELEKKINILIQINIASEETKNGIKAGEIDNFLVEIKSCPNLILRGIMTFPPPGGEKKWFKISKEIFDNLKSDQCDTLSMGTSDDFREAIDFGSNMVRLGTVLFGHRE